MKIPWVNKQLIQKRNRIIARIAKFYQRNLLKCKIWALRCLAFMLNCVNASFAAPISEEILSCGVDGTVTLCCLGAVDMAAGETYPRDLAALHTALDGADAAFAMPMGSTAPEAAAVDRLLRDHRVLLQHPEKPVCSRLYDTTEGKLAVITYDCSQPCTRGIRDKLTIMRHILAAKRRGAAYSMLYVNQPKSGRSHLCKVLAHMGADYVVGITPDRCDGGTTYRRHSGQIARSVLSAGTFLGGNSAPSCKQVVLRLKLARINGSLTLTEETYLPFFYSQELGPISLLDGQNQSLPSATAIQYRAELEEEMRRIRPLDRLLTVGRIMELSETVLPEHLRYLQDFSVGKVCARASDVKPGDVFFFREPFADPNDLEPVSQEHRLRVAKAAARRGALLIVSFRPLPFACRHAVCPNTVEGHIRVSAYLRRQFATKTIAISGSVGKTSTKDMLCEVLRMRFHTVKSERNANVQAKIAENLQNLTSACEMFIQEIGGGRPGGASRHARMVLPQVCVLTNIGDAHIGNFGSKEKLMENKLGIIDGMGPDGVLYLNADDPLLDTARPACQVVRYAVHNRNADYYVEDLRQAGAGCSFSIVHNGEKTPVTLHVLGEYNVLHAVCCFAIGRQFGMTQADIAAGLAHFHTTGIRQNLMEVCGRKLFMDCYNASSESMLAALEILQQIEVAPGKKRIAVVGDITGLGALAPQVHRQIGHTILQYPLDCVLLFGEDVKHTYEVLRQQHKDVRHFTQREDLNRALQQTVDIGDAVMFKGSSKMLLEYSVDMVYGTQLTDQRLRDEREYKYARRGSIVYDLFADYATAAVYDPLRSGERRVQVASQVGSIEVVNMGRALRGRNITEVILPDTIRHIAAEAFMNCAQLSGVRMPKKLKYIGNGAFRNCRNLRHIKLPEQVMHIGKEAFAGCRNLQSVTIPASVVQIGEDAFTGCENCTFSCPKGSYAERYLRTAGLLKQTV